MQAISETDIRNRIKRDNFWWNDPTQIFPEATHPRRVYFPSFKALALDYKVKRASVLLGPRRVGKTFMIKQLIHDAIVAGTDPHSILFVSIDTPLYSNMPLESFLKYMPNGADAPNSVVVFDEIQYLKDWERHLKDLVDNYGNIKFIATGSAAAALRLKSRESGAGRFSEYILPPLTFHEFLMFMKRVDDLIEDPVDRSGIGVDRFYRTTDINILNNLFVDYLNYGGYPEAVLNEQIRSNSEQYISNDIVNKVLLNDLPSLYGIKDITELKKISSFLAYNTGNEASLQDVCQGTESTKPTIKKYVEYLESAFLILKLSNVDDNCKSLLRERNFKVYLNNPSMRAALFGPVLANDSAKIGHLAEAAVFSQWQHALDFGDLRYARWDEGEVDVVLLDKAAQKPLWVGEIKWSDRFGRNKYEVTGKIRAFMARHKGINSAFFTSRTISENFIANGKSITVVPTAIYCYSVGKNITSILSKGARSAPDVNLEAAE